MFYQGEDVNSALGIAVLGNKVFVSVSPNVFVFTDENGDGIAGVELWDVAKYPDKVTTDANGFYMISGYQGGEIVWINANSQLSSYNVQASGWDGGVFVHDGSVITGRNFIFSRKPGTLSGRVTTPDGKGIASLTLIWQSGQHEKANSQLPGSSRSLWNY